MTIKAIIAHANKHRVSTLAIFFFITYAVVRGWHHVLSLDKLIDPIILVVLEHLVNAGGAE